MKIHIELKKKRYILYAAIIALLGVVGANISILHTNADKITKHIEYKSFLTQLIAVFRVSITNKEGNGIFYQLMAAGLFILFLIVFSYKYTVREVISAAILSILYGFCMWIGTVFSHRESWDYFLRNKYVMLLNAFYILGNAIKECIFNCNKRFKNLWLQFFLSQNQGFMRLFEKTVLK